MSERKPINSWSKIGLTGLGAGALMSAASMLTARYLVDRLTRLTPVTATESYTFSPFETQVEYEEVTFPTANGRLLSGWWLPRSASRRVVIAVSGYRGRKEDMLGISSFLWRNGFNVLLFDYRAHGVAREEGEMLTLGHRELQDLQAAIVYVRQRVSQPWLGLLGGSMGAAVVLLATARDKDIKAVWADSAFTSQHDVIRHNWRMATNLPDQPVLSIAARLFEGRTGHRWEDFAPLAEIGLIAPRPVYLVHAAQDTMIPVEQAYRLYAAAGEPKELWIEENLEHCGVYFRYRSEYSRRAVAFFEKYLVEQPSGLPTANPESALSAGRQ